MKRRSSTRTTLLLLLVGCLTASIRAGTVADDASLSLADLEAYRAALAAKAEPSAPLVSFRDLWDRPEAHVGKVVAVQGRVARTFRQAKLGEFPPLVEAWVVSTAGDPFCLIFPQVDGSPTLDPGASVRFSGTFLKRIKYQGGDVARLAPLIVGPEAPSTPHPIQEAEGMTWTSTDWMMALGAALVVGLILARRQFSRPTQTSPSYESAPTFVDGDPDA